MMRNGIYKYLLNQQTLSMLGGFEMIDFGNKLKTLRIQNNFTQAQPHPNQA